MDKSLTPNTKWQLRKSGDIAAPVTVERVGYMTVDYRDSSGKLYTVLTEWFLDKFIPYEN